MPLTIERNPLTIITDLFFGRRSSQSETQPNTHILIEKEWFEENKTEYVKQDVSFNQYMANRENFRRQKLIEERDNAERALSGELLDKIKADWVEYCKQYGGNEQDIVAIEEFFAGKKSCKKLLTYVGELHAFNKICQQTNLPDFIRDYIFNNTEKTAEVAIRKKLIEEKDYQLLLMTPYLRLKMATEQPLCNKLAIEAVEKQLKELELDNNVLLPQCSP